MGRLATYFVTTEGNKGKGNQEEKRTRITRRRAQPATKETERERERENDDTSKNDTVRMADKEGNPNKETK